ncbi:hypothetical protein ECARS42123_2791 [Escherichia coli ARS4.2123]|nr:hypothetical protein ECARS42123_2791 [Escherichia coli ARS4.2123]
MAARSGLSYATPTFGPASSNKSLALSVAHGIEGLSKIMLMLFSVIIGHASAGLLQ